MKEIYLRKIFRSHYCQLVFVAALIGGYFLIPTKAFVGIYMWLAGIFILLFALIITCLVRNIKERVKSKRKHGGSVVGVLASAVGLSAFQVCSIGAPVCGASLGIVFVSSILPSFFLDLLMEYSDLILISMILIQFSALVYMGCLKRLTAGLADDSRDSL